MMSLLKHATVLVVVGYAGGEEGVMNLLQYAARTIPRMVVYWVAYEKSYREFRSEEHTSELQVTNAHLVCRLLLEKKKNINNKYDEHNSEQNTIQSTTETAYKNKEKHEY